MKKIKLYSLGVVLIVLLSGCTDKIGIKRERVKPAPVDIETERKPTHNWWPEGSCIIASPETSSPYYSIKSSIMEHTSLNLIDTKEYWETNFPGKQPNNPIAPDNLLSEDAIRRSQQLGVGYIMVISFVSSSDTSSYVIPLGFITSVGTTREITHSIYLIDLSQPNDGDLIQAVIKYGDYTSVYLIPLMNIETTVRPSDKEYKTIALNIEKQIKYSKGNNLSGVVLLQMVPCL
jgi:hypothetical protein